MPVELSSVRLYVHHDRFHELLNLLPRFDHVHVKKTGDQLQNLTRRAVQRSEQLASLEADIGEIEDNIQYLFQYFGISTKEPPFSEKRLFSADNLEALVSDIADETTHFYEMVSAANKLFTHLDFEIERLEILKAALVMLREQGFQMDQLGPDSLFSFHLYTTFSSNIDQLQYLLEEAEITNFFHEEKISPERSIFYLIVSRSQEEETRRLLGVQNCEEIKVPPMYMELTEENIADCTQQIRQLRVNHAKITENLEHFRTEKYKDFIAAREVLENIKKFMHIEQHSVLTPEGHVVLETWVPSLDVPAFEEKLRDVFSTDIRVETRCYTRSRAARKAKKDREKMRADRAKAPEKVSALANHHDPCTNVPTMMKHNRFVAPFETLVELYGLPNYQELDPTPLVAIFFPIIFGLMFGDVGHGLVLVIVGIVAVTKFRKVDHKNKAVNFGIILFYCGLGAIFGGFLYGEWMGNHMMWHGHHVCLFVNPLASPSSLMVILKACILLGVVHINTGWLMECLNYWRARKRYQAVSDSLVKMLVLDLGTVLIFTWGFDIDAWFVGAFPPILLVVIPALLFIALRPLGKLLGVSYLKEDTYGALVGEGGMESFELFLGILSNVASYSRIFALLMAHVGLMTVIQSLANLVAFEGVGGRIVLNIILILGNAFVIALETLLVLIQDLRLHFYEFFSKFFKGDGLPFVSMRVSEEYSQIQFTVFAPKQEEEDKRQAALIEVSRPS